jgi:light-regulated signal transduction histidine kinase (bacteriophytochrome)
MTNLTPRTSELPAYLSHEIRNALACIHQFGNILVGGLAGELSSEQREYVRIMLENASQIRKVLDSEPERTADPLKASTERSRTCF